MRIIRVDSGEPIAEAAIEATTVWSRFRGLMLRQRMEPDDALIIRPCGSIHMMFMRFRIDAIFFDGDGRVTKVARNVPTWRGLAFGGRGAKGVIELRPGGADGLAPGDQLEFTP